MNTMRSAILGAAVLAVAHVGARPLTAHEPRSHNQYQYQHQSGQRLSGTYQLDRTRSDDPRQVADMALRELPVTDRSTVSQRLMNRLDPPDVIALDQSGLHVSIASSRAGQMSFDADGRPQTGPLPSGRMLTTRATVTANRLEVSAQGQTGIDFSVTFEPIDNGNSLRVTRQLYDDQLRQPVVVNSVYRKISDTPDWDVYAGPNTMGRPAYNASEASASRDGSAIVPEGTTLVATLNQPLDVRTIRQRDRVTLTVRSAPRADVDGAVIDGYVVNTRANIDGRTNLTIDFDQIRLRDGRTANFDGRIEAIRGPNGDSIAYNDEPPQANPQQTQQAVERGAIGAALGAVIGAVAGGGKGAAIGAVLGGGGAAATVYVDPLNQRELPQGTEFTIRALRER